MKISYKIFCFIAASVFLSACTPQKYQTRYAYIPPQTQGGAACVQQCSVQQNQCKQRFSGGVKQCRVRAKQQALKEMPGRIAAYETALNVWEARIARYERDLRFSRLRRHNHSILDEVAYDRCRNGKHKNDKSCRRYHRPRWHGGYWLDKPVYPGKAPRRPTLAGVTAEISAKTCQQRSQCSSNYQQCYTACGGKVKPYKLLLRD